VFERLNGFSSRAEMVREDAETLKHFIASCAPENCHKWSISPNGMCTRHERSLDRPDVFDPPGGRLKDGKVPAKPIAFSPKASRCPAQALAWRGRGFIRRCDQGVSRFETVAGRTPVRLAHLTVRSKDGIWLIRDSRARALLTRSSICSASLRYDPDPPPSEALFKNIHAYCRNASSDLHARAHINSRPQAR